MVNGCYNQKGIITSGTVQFIDRIKVVRKRNNSRHVVEIVEIMRINFEGHEPPTRWGGSARLPAYTLVTMTVWKKPKSKMLVDVLNPRAWLVAVLNPRIRQI